jgi:hypothetical protein
MCNEAARSREHVFPAALGGRRTNKGIYCTLHNNSFGRHVAELQKQLLLLNSILMVRPDRHDEARPFVFTDKDSNHLSMVGQNIQTAAPPSIEDLILEPGDKNRLKFGSMEQFKQWREAQKKTGWDPRIADSTEIQRHHFADPLQVQLTLGGKEALQAVGYLALTFFAHCFPVAARQKGLDHFKDFLKLDFSKVEDQRGWEPNLVWWDGRDAELVVGENPFNFGHAIVVGVTGVTNRAYAYISFFSSLNFGVALGPVEDAHESMVQVFIDPKAEKAPEDLKATCSDTFSIDIDPAMSDLGQMIQSGSAQAAMQRFFNKAGAWHFDLFIEEMRVEIEGWVKSQPADRDSFAEALVEKHSQRVLNLLSKSSSGLRAHFTGENFPKKIFTLLDSIVESDDSQANGLSPQTNVFLERAKKEITKAIKNELDGQYPSPEQLALLLAGGQGVGVVTQTIVLPILLNLPR